MIKHGKIRLLITGLTVTAIASAVSHLAARAIRFRTEAVEPLTFGSERLPIGATAAGSSLMFYGINWTEVSKALGTRVRGWAVPGGSVEEMEVLQRGTPPAGHTLLDVALNDLNENYVSEFHSDVVPFRESLASLLASGTGWAHTKQVLSQYPLKCLRVLFPTAGRSTHVMVGIREGLRSLRRRPAAEPSERAALANETNTHDDSIKAWPPARRLRQLGDARASASSTFQYGGPKREALFRFLRRGAAQGRMIVVVLPESPTYMQELVMAETQRSFEAVLTEARARTPEAIWVRLDATPELQSDDYYWDLIHLNAPGQALATQLLLAELKTAGILR